MLINQFLEISWDKEFNAQEFKIAAASAPLQVIPQNQQILRPAAVEGDELARTAGLLLDNMKGEQNPKFQNSAFMGLMKQLRDGNVIVEGNQMVENTGQSTAVASGSQSAVGARPTLQGPYVGPQHGTQMSASAFAREALAKNSQEGEDILEDSNDAYFRQENADYTRYWNESGLETTRGLADQVPEWEKLQSDWDNFEATTTGITPVNSYHFQGSNPYLTGDSSTTRHHMVHQGVRQSVFEVSIQLLIHLGNSKNSNFSAEHIRT